MTNRILKISLALLAGLAASCSGEATDPSGGGGTGTGGTAGSGGGGGADAFAAARQSCVDKINELRASEGKPPYERWVAGEGCADEQAALDATTDSPHGNFGMCEESAQNTCLWRDSVEAVVGGCLDQMWAEGPGEPFSEHGHYLNMSSDQYTQVACGFYEGPDGSIWASQNFR